MFSLDTETNGSDWGFGSKPYFVTTCDDYGEVKFWQWDVDPLTRKPVIPRNELKAIQDLLTIVSKWGKASDTSREYHKIVGHNIKFDVHALASIGIKDWPWDMTHDTLVAGHLLSSNTAHDLTSMVMRYLGEDIEKFEKDIEVAVQECRRWARTNKPDWAIAKKGREDMPSAKEKTWKIDMWLPRAVARERELPDDHPYWTVLEKYANSDSGYTMLLWPVLRDKLKSLDLYDVYLDQMKVLPILKKMENHGVTFNKTRAEELRVQYIAESDKCKQTCIRMSEGTVTDFPKNGKSKTIETLVFDKWKLVPCKKTKKGNPCMDKDVLEQWLLELRRNTKQYIFVKNLRAYRKRQTALGYIESYYKYAIPLSPSDDPIYDGWYVLYSNTNMTGTDTTRMSMNNPNGQQCSKKEIEALEGEKGKNARYMFGPGPGRCWYTMDYANIELRIPAYLSKEQELIDLFERYDKPPYYGSEHLLNFSTVFPDVWERELKIVGIDKVGPHCKEKYKSSHYQDCKNGDFAIGYSCGRAKADATFRRVGSFDRLKSRFSKKEALNQTYIRLAKKHGYIETLPIGTNKRGYTLLCGRGERGGVLSTTPLNYAIQGEASLAIRRAMVRCDMRLMEWGPDYKMVLGVHDELIFDFPERDDDRARELRTLMEQSGDDIGIPLKVEASYHSTSWSEGEKI